MKVINNKAKTSSVDRIFTIMRGLLILSPFVALGYLTVDSARAGGVADWQTIIGSNPNNTVMFIVAMMNPFIAYLLGFVKDHLNMGDYDYGMLNLILMVVAEVMLQNFIYALGIAFLTNKCSKVYQAPIKGCLKRKIGNHLFRDISGSIVVLALAGLCMFAMLRLG